MVNKSHEEIKKNNVLICLLNLSNLWQFYPKWLKSEVQWQQMAKSETKHWKQSAMRRNVSVSSKTEFKVKEDALEFCL